MGIHFENVTYKYEDGKLFSRLGLSDLTVTLKEKSFTAIIGASGSGKSTMLQHLNGLLQPAEGSLAILNFHLGPNTGKNGRSERKLRARTLAGLRKRVGLVFQFPEQQLFEATVQDDLQFGPLNFGYSKQEAAELARKAAALLGLDDSLLQRSPFELSGGQMRKAAIAAVLAADPDIIVLDEPTSGLDQESRKELLELLHNLSRLQGKTIIIVTHRLEEVLPYADQYVVIHHGKAVVQGNSGLLLRQPELLAEAGIVLPPSIRLMLALSEQFHAPLPEEYLNPEKAAAWIKGLLLNNAAMSGGDLYAYKNGVRAIHR
ncbi:ABC transporter ATP-binding protein [Paenibacillus agaridevorans]|uniref:ABC transporter ATP-binding protein n=1 Tax=Paenibacillus agaridevorans TaxID=171404 RepID=A0A2R5ETR0_9BACL|nr:ATP-binding cassette domain-containing protein [Paenibacillus agaridevorans]GBG10062.1 ABC transporter ATP-binding protein [Paenibacillus agaridevorans]